MIKKIGAIALALVLCLSVIVVPASAAKVELGDAKMAFSLEWDKASYSAGETAYLSVYMTADDLALATGSFLIGLNSSVISQADNPIETVKANAVTSDLFGSYWKKAATNLSWLNASVQPKVVAANTAEEQALYDNFLKYTAAKNIAGSHENAGNNKDGFYGSEFNLDEPIMTIALVVASDVADGTALNAAITTGSRTSVPAQTAWKYYNNPGNAPTAANLAAADIDVSQAVATATVGEEAKAILNPIGSQIRFNTENDVYAGNFDYRYRAVISGADFAETFGSEDAAKEMITDIGFVFAEGTDAFTMAQAKDVVENGSDVAGVTKKAVSYIQNRGSDYMFTCLITGITDKTKSCTVLAYVGIDTDADGVADTFSYYPTVVSSSFEALYDQYKSNVQGA